MRKKAFYFSINKEVHGLYMGAFPAGGATARAKSRIVEIVRERPGFAGLTKIAAGRGRDHCRRDARACPGYPRRDSASTGQNWMQSIAYPLLCRTPGRRGRRPAMTALGDAG